MITVMKKTINKKLNLYFKPNYPKVINNSYKKKYIVTLGIGGNIGDVLKRFNLLFNMLKSNNKTTLLKTSTILKNPPFGYINQDYFYNAIIQIGTNLPPHQVLKLCWYYENRFKRKRSFKDAPRTLDIDIIMIKKYGKDIRIDTKNLVVPHKEYKNRQSVTIPLIYI